MEGLKNASFEGKTKFKLPKGATVTKKDISIRVKEIENGFVITKSYDISWSKENKEGEVNTGYEYFSKEWYAKENPIKIDEEFEEDLSLSDKFE